MATHAIRVFGDPVLKQRAQEVANIDDSLRQLAADMLQTMYAAPGIGLAAPQVGVQRRFFVYDMGEHAEGDGPKTLVNPVITESRGEWEHEEGCLSVPGLSWTIVRPKEVHLRARDLEGEEVSIEADALEARLFQHELDHLDGVLLIDRLDSDQRKEAMRLLRSPTTGFAPPGGKAAQGSEL